MRLTPERLAAIQQRCDDKDELGFQSLAERQQNDRYRSDVGDLLADVLAYRAALEVARDALTAVSWLMETEEDDRIVDDALTAVRSALEGGTDG